MQRRAEPEGKTVDELADEAVQRHLATRWLERTGREAQFRRGNMTEANRSRHSYDLEKRAALDFWDQRLDQIVSQAKQGVGIFGARATHICRYACSGIE